MTSSSSWKYRKNLNFLLKFNKVSMNKTYFSKQFFINSLQYKNILKNLVKQTSAKK